MPLYEDYCSKCDYTNEHYEPLPTTATSPCPKCGGETDRLYSLHSVRVFESFETRNILPDGKPVKVTSQSQLRQLEAEHHVKRIDDPRPPQTNVE